MASKNDDYYDDYDDDEEDEGDFVPGADDDDELDDDFEDENLDDDEEDSPFLQGDLYLDDGNAIVYDDAKHSNQSFRLTSEGSLPASWSLAKPVLEKPVSFVGWLKDPSLTLKFEVGITKLDSSVTIDPLEQRFLEAQQQAQPLLAVEASSDSKPPARAKGGDSEDDEDVKPASSKAPASPDGKKAALGGDVYVFEGSELTKDKNGNIRKIRGLFRVPGDKVSRIFLMSGVQANPAASSSASPAAKAAPAAAARKRGRGEEDDDDGDDGVGYNELIALHDDAGLSTEELRRKYYGSGASEPDSKKPKPSADEDDDSDDDYGF
jgi:hypothetical protein